MEKLYKNKEWLENKYINEKIPIRQISKLCGVNKGTIHWYLDKFEIKKRTSGESYHWTHTNHTNLTKESIDWIQGELLGDGCLYSYNKYSATFRYGSKHLEYINYISKRLEAFGIERTGKIRKNKEDIYHYASLCYKELKPLREKWYPTGKKIVPKDVELTPITVRQWFIGDGNLQFVRQRKNYKPYPELVIYTCGFPISDVEFLIFKLKEIGIEATRQSYHNSVHIRNKSLASFYSYIGSCPTECYKYKWRTA